MAYQLRVSDESRLDTIDAFLWYELQRKGLGKDFELCLEAALNELSRNPLIYKEIRICYIRRFPYGIHYLVEENKVSVFGVFHTSKNPNSWAGRLK